PVGWDDCGRRGCERDDGRPCTVDDKDAPVPRTLAPGQLSRIHVLDVDTGQDRILHESSTVLYEAPNWTLDGTALILNGDGHLFHLALDGGAPRRIDLGEIAPLNNDHVLDPDGVHVVVSADDGRIHRAPPPRGPATGSPRTTAACISSTASAPTAPPSCTPPSRGTPTAPGCRRISPPSLREAGRPRCSPRTSSRTTAPSSPPTAPGSSSTPSAAAQFPAMRSCSGCGPTAAASSSSPTTSG